MELKGFAAPLENDRLFILASIDDMNKPRLIVIVLKENPIRVVHDAGERRVVSVVLFSEPRLACDEELSLNLGDGRGQAAAA